MRYSVFTMISNIVIDSGVRLIDRQYLVIDHNSKKVIHKFQFEHLAHTYCSSMNWKEKRAKEKA